MARLGSGRDGGADGAAGACHHSSAVTLNSFYNVRSYNPVSPKLAASAFKIGQTYSRLGEYHKARLMFDRVLDQYSEGAEAHLARKALNVMPPQN